MATALIIDDEKANRALLRFHCEELGLKVEEFNNSKALLKRIGTLDGSEIIFLDIVMPDIDGFELLASIRERDKRVPIVMVTAREDPESIIRCLRLGATDYLPKGFSAARLQASIKNATAVLSLQEELDETKAALDSLTSVGNVVARSPATQDIIRLLAHVQRTDATVLLLGESGVGKEVFARYIHFESDRRHQPFIAVNCAAIPETLFESELFGHEAGAFTGAVERRIGKFEAAKNGTLFLDEIGEMSASMQARLLRVLQDRIVTPIGGNREIPVRARVICATNKMLEREVQEGRFRRDLYFRLNAFPVPIPPLRSRRDDIEPLANFFVQKFSAKFEKEIDAISQKAIAELLRYSWPGNIRELENTVERAVLLCQARTLDLEHFKFESPSAPQPAQADMKPAQATPFHIAFQSPGDIVDYNIIDGAILASAIRACNGDISDAARRLGLSRSTIYARLKKHGIDPQRIKGRTQVV